MLSALAPYLQPTTLDRSTTSVLCSRKTVDMTARGWFREDARGAASEDIKHPLIVSFQNSKRLNHTLQNQSSRESPYFPFAMLSSVTIGASALALASFLQLCPAPPVVIAAGITASGAIIGGAISTAGKVKRQELPPGVPQEEYDRCFDELRTANVVVSGPVGNNGKSPQICSRSHESWWGFRKQKLLSS